MHTLTKEQLKALPVGTKLMGTGEDKITATITDENTITWADGVESHFGYRSCPAGTEFSVEVVK